MKRECAGRLRNVLGASFTACAYYVKIVVQLDA